MNYEFVLVYFANSIKMQIQLLFFQNYLNRAFPVICLMSQQYNVERDI